MNIFYLSSSPVLAAQLQCDKHVVKMILETAQMLSTAHRLTQESVPDVLYKVTHKNHPSTVWVRSNQTNYMWTYLHFKALCDEYTRRYGKVHQSWKKLGDVLKYPPSLSEEQFCPPPQCMPEEFHCEDAVDAYRAYYQSKQDSFKMTWTNRDIPDWFEIKG